MAKPVGEFFPDRPVPAGTKCNEDGCGSPATMAVRVNGQERFLCYHHVSLLYNRLHLNLPPKTSRDRTVQ
jgi:hypothetical protein